MKIINSLKTHLKEPYQFKELDMTIFTYIIKKRFLFWKYYKIKQIMPNVRKPVFDHEFPTAMKVKLTAQRDYQQMWEWLNEYKNSKNK